MDKYNVLNNNKLDLQRKSKTQQANWVKMRDIKRMHRRMTEDIKTHKLLSAGPKNASEFRLLQAYVAFLILDEIHFRNDLNSFKLANTVFDSKDNSNYFVISRMEFSIVNFKLKRSFQRRGIKLPLKFGVSKKLAKILRQFLKVKPNSEYLFSTFSGEKLPKNSIRNILTGASKRYLNVRLGTTMLRHLYISEFDKSRPTLAQRRIFLRKCLQLNVEQQLRYVRNEELSEDSE